MVCFYDYYQMDPTPSIHVGFTKSASRWYPKLALIAWVLYSPSHELIHLDRVCIGAANNNHAMYDVMTSLLTISL